MRLLYILTVLVFVGCAPHEPKLIFEEQFEGNVLNDSIWNYQLGDGCPNLCGWGNNEPQIYTKENARVENGFLIISATKDSTGYKSARLTTKDKFNFQYGTIEARLQLPKGQGLWPAFWMLGSDIDEVGWPKSGEIDIMEYVGREPHILYTSLHTPDSHGNTINSKKTTFENLEEGFHTYKAEWTKDFIKFYMDDQLVYTFSPEVKDASTWPFNKQFYVLLNMAIGGNFGGPEIDDTIFPQDYIIDYIKVYQ